MGFIHLAAGVLFDTTNEAGTLFNTATGTCLDLDPLATLFLQTALEGETKAHILATLASRIDATQEQLEEALQAVLAHLLTHRFLSTTVSSHTGGDEAEHVPAFSAEGMMAQPQLSRHSHIDWEFFLTGQIVNSPLPRFSCFRRGYACWKTGTILFFMGYTHLVASLLESLRRPKRAAKVRQHAWEVLAQRLSHLGSYQSEVDAACAVRVARRELVWCQMLVRALAPTAVCLVRSIAFCTYLRTLGLPATVVIGRACFDLSSKYSFHAWTELAGLVINDHTELQTGYKTIQRLPLHEETAPYLGMQNPITK